MRIKLTYITPLLAAGAAAVAIAAAPTAARQMGRPAREISASHPAMFRSTTPVPLLVTTPTETCRFCSAATVAFAAAWADT